MRTVMAAAAGDHDALDRSAANQARFTFAAVDTMLQLEETLFTMGINVIRDRGTAESNRLL